MDFKEKYQEALERAKKGLPIDEVFPELKESKDERIRKEIITHLSNELHNVKQLTPRTNEFEAWIAYLEKQKEQKDVSASTMAPGCWQGEEKSAEWSEEDERMLSRCIKSVECSKRFANSETYKAAKDVEMNWLKELSERFNLQPKQEWNEDEKMKLNRIYAILGQAADTHAFSTTCRLIGDKEAVELQDFLRSIAKPKSWELSEEDKKIIGRLRSVVNECAFKNDALDVNGDYCEGDYAELDNWLKSLRPSFRPSKEQMEALARATNRCVGVDDAKILVKLLERLEKL